MKPSAFRALTLAAIVALSCGSLAAATLTFTPASDASIRSDQLTAANNSNVLLVGTLTGGALRSLLSFDLSSSAALVGATINSVTLTLTENDKDTSGGGSTSNTLTLDLNLLPSTFTESATWQTSDGTNTWTSGSPYTASPILSSATGAAGTASAGNTLNFISSSAFTNAVSSSVSGTGILNLAVKLDDETLGARNIFRFTSSEPISVSASYEPLLTIDYTAAAIPEPSTYAMLGGLAVLGLALRRRRAC